METKAVAKSMLDDDELCKGTEEKRKSEECLNGKITLEAKRQKIDPDKALACDQIKGLSKNKRRKIVKQLCHERHWQKTKGKPLHILYSRTGGTGELQVDSEYYFENGLRKVKPYFFDFNTFCKGRWVGKTLSEVYSTEFRLYPFEYYQKLREKGRILLNLETVGSFDVVIKDNDMLTSRIHRHEGAVVDAPIEIIEDNSKFLVVDKPSSIPVHPCGRYRMNSLVFLLQNQYGYKNLSGCYRIDRPTSGLVMFGKTKQVAGKVHSLIRQRKVEKEYLCKVVGEFPETIECRQPVTNFNEKLGFQVAWEVEGAKSKDAWTIFERVRTDGETSVVLCKPKSGRTHQIRVHLQYLGYPIVNDPVYNHHSWGPERFGLGPVTKDLDQIVLELTSKYDFRQNHVSEKDETFQQSKDDELKKSKNEQVVPSCVTTPLSVHIENTSEGLDGGDSGVSTHIKPEQSNKDNSSCIHPSEESNNKEDNIDQSGPSKEVPVTSKSTNEVDEASSKPDTNLWEKVEDCPECLNPSIEPKPEDLVMFLHAYKYKSEEWEFETKLPQWAK